MERMALRAERVERLVKAHSKRLHALAFTYLRNSQDAEDVVQEVFLSYLRAAPPFQDGEHEKAWLLRVAINRCKNQLRGGWLRLRRPMPDDLGYMMQEESALVHAVAALGEKYRLPIHLHYYEGYAIREIAEILGEKSATIGTRLARGRALLKDRIGGIENV